MKILFVSPLPPPAASGIANWTKQLLKVLDKRSVDYDIVDTAVRWRTPTDLNFLKRLTGGTLQAFYVIFKTIFKLFTYKPDVVHICSSGSMSLSKDCLLLLILKVFRAKSVFHVRIGRIPELSDKKNWEYRFIRAATKLSTKTVLIDKASYDTLDKDGLSDRIVNVPNFIDICQAEDVVPFAQGKTRGDVKNLLFAGHVIPTKGICELFEALKSLENKKILLHLAGPVTENFKKELDSYGINERVVFHGEVSKAEVLSLMKFADAFVFPTYTEGFPNVIMEAMICRLPVLSTPVGAIPEILDFDTETPCGYKFDVRSSESLAEALGYFYDNGKEFELFSERAYKKVCEYYSSESVVQKLIDLWSVV